MQFLKSAPTTSPTLIVDGNPSRLGLTLINYGSVTVFIDTHDEVTTATGFPLEADDSLIIASSTESIYGITTSGTGDIRVAEV